jgi:hypothetical protein
MANTYTLIASYAATGSVSNIEFTSIPATYTDLLVKTSLRGSGGTDIKIQFNGSTASVYSYVRLYGTGSATNSTTTTTTNLINNMVAQSSYTASTFGNGEIYIPNYTSTANAKSVSIDGVTENNATASFQTLTAGRWNPATQAAITSIKLEIDGGGDFAQYSTAYLYGIKNS